MVGGATKVSSFEHWNQHSKSVPTRSIRLSRQLSNLTLGAMISSSNLFHKTHYDILGVKEDANLEEVRKAYRSAILCFHPDKQQNGSETSNSECLTENKVLEIQKAWENIGNPRSRARYKAELLTLRQDATISEDVNLDGLTSSGFWRYYRAFLSL